MKLVFSPGDSTLTSLRSGGSGAKMIGGRQGFLKGTGEGGVGGARAGGGRGAPWWSTTGALCLLLGFQLGSMSWGWSLFPRDTSSVGVGGGRGEGGEGGAGGSGHKTEGQVMRDVRVLLRGHLENLTAQNEAMRSALTGSSLPSDSINNYTRTSGAECAHNNWNNQSGIIHWNPKPARYLLAMCSGGQLSNRLACFRQNMLDAALMNRTLIIPTNRIDYNYDILLDLSAVETCFGPNRVIRFDDYHEMVSGRVRVGRMVCHVHIYQTEEVCEQLAKRYRDTLGIDFAKKEIAKRRTSGPWFKYPSADFLKKFNSDHHVIAFANMFGVGGRDHPFHGPSPLIASSTCTGFLQPSKPIKEAAIGFVNTYLGEQFVAVHLRRGDFFGHCLKGSGRKRRLPCFHPLPQLASCLHRRLSSLRLVGGAIFLATNADPMELQLLRASLLALGRKEPMVQLGEGVIGQGWAEPLVKSGVAENSEVLSFVDKTICALSTRFLGTSGSTFTHDIMRMREWWYHGLVCDSYICPAEEPSQIIPFPLAAEDQSTNSTQSSNSLVPSKSAPGSWTKSNNQLPLNGKHTQKSRNKSLPAS